MAAADISRPIRLAVVLLAAGRSERMGQPKLLLAWAGTSICGHLITQWRSLGAEQIGMVCAVNAFPLYAELDRLDFSASDRILNPAPERGMFSSIQCAAQWPGWHYTLTHWAIVLGDQPHLRVGSLQRLLAFASEHREQICLPLQDGHRRHPVLLPKGHFQELVNTNAANLKEFLDAHRDSVAACLLDDEDLALDVDTPEDYKRALMLWERFRDQ